MFGYYIGILIIILAILISSLKSEPRIRRQYGYSAQTLQGEEVKSHAEKTIADYFLKNGINYKYEHEIRGIGSPDFYLPDYDVVVEYWGLVDAEDERLRNRYVRNMRWKMAQYHSRKIKFISIYPQNLSNLDAIFKSKFRKVTGEQLH